MNRRVLRPEKAVRLVVISVLLLAVGEYVRPSAGQNPAPLGEVDVFPVRGNIYMVVGAGGNVTLQVGNDGVLVVDTGTASMSEKVLAAIRTLSNKPIRWIVNTHVDADHTGGNAVIARAGESVPQIAVGVGKLFSDAERVATIVAHENVQKRMSAPTGQQSQVPADGLPTATFFTEEEELFFNEEPIQILHQPAAHTDGDVLVFFRRSDVVASGDVFMTTGYPVIDIPRGGTINGLVDALNEVIHITIPREKQEGGTYVVPGHGRLSDEADVVDYRDMATIVRDRIQALLNAGRTLEEVKAARPTLDYDGRYGATSGPWTTDMFIEAVYRTLSQSTPRNSAAPRNSGPPMAGGAE